MFYGVGLLSIVNAVQAFSYGLWDMNLDDIEGPVFIVRRPN
jgi:hypothetical protein